MLVKFHGDKFGMVLLLLFPRTIQCVRTKGAQRRQIVKTNCANGLLVGIRAKWTAWKFVKWNNSALFFLHSVGFVTLVFYIYWLRILLLVVFTLRFTVHIHIRWHEEAEWVFLNFVRLSETVLTKNVDMGVREFWKPYFWNIALSKRKILYFFFDGQSEWCTVNVGNKIEANCMLGERR